MEWKIVKETKDVSWIDADVKKNIETNDYKITQWLSLITGVSRQNNSYGRPSTMLEREFLNGRGLKDAGADPDAKYFKAGDLYVGAIVEHGIKSTSFSGGYPERNYTYYKVLSLESKDPLKPSIQIEEITKEDVITYFRGDQNIVNRAKAVVIKKISHADTLEELKNELLLSLTVVEARLSEEG